MIRLLNSLIFSVLFAAISYANAPSYHRVSAKAGDGVYTLLKRYDLSAQRSNHEQFYKLNNLKKSDQLLKGKKYKLPVLIYTYNGVSIRSTIGNQDMAKAKRIKAYNDNLLAKGLRSKSYVSSKILWVPYHEISDTEVIKNNKSAETTTTAVDKSYINIPMFGDKYENVKLFDNRLKNKVFYVVAGHGGPDPGAVCESCPSTLCEDEYAYDVSLRLARNLMQHGAIVHMIIQDPNDGIRDGKVLKCDKDEKCMGKKKIPLNSKLKLKQRADEINKLYRKYKKQGIQEQSTIVVHIDSQNKTKRQDVFFYYYAPSKKSKKLAHNVQKTFKKKYDIYQKGRGYKGYVQPRSLYMTRNTLSPTVFVELANIRNVHDHERILKSSNRQALANWLFEGLTGIK